MTKKKKILPKRKRILKGRICAYKEMNGEKGRLPIGSACRRRRWAFEEKKMAVVSRLYRQ